METLVTMDCRYRSPGYGGSVHFEDRERQREPRSEGCNPADVGEAIDKTAQILGLDESGEELADRLLAAQFVETYLRPRP
jgi:hypothetical protein